MKQRLKGYLQSIEEVDFDSLSEKERASLKDDLLIQIKFFQHERLIHLIVTVTFAILTLLGVLGCLAWPGIAMYLLAGLLLVLLVPYIGHYYLLENGVQELYNYYDKVTSEL